MMYQASVVAVAHDDDLTTYIQNVVVAQGGRPLLVKTPDAFMTAVDRWFPVLILVEWKSEASSAGTETWAEAIRRCKLRPQTRHIPIYAFGDESNSVTQQQARRAGADSFWDRRCIKADLDALVRRHIDPPTRFLEGWDDLLSEQARTGLELLNQGEFFEQHEALEEAWLAEPRPIREMYQGILQVGLAYLQIEQDNWPGAIKMFRRGLPKLRGLPEVCQGVRIGDFCARAEEIHWQLTRSGPEALRHFDIGAFSHIEYKKVK